MDAPGLPAGPQPVPAATAVIYPSIADWLNYCDSHPDRAGEDFQAHIAVFERHGYWHMNQLAGPRMTIKKLSDWLSIQQIYWFSMLRKMLHWSKMVYFRWNWKMSDCTGSTYIQCFIQVTCYWKRPLLWLHSPLNIHPCAVQHVWGKNMGLGFDVGSWGLKKRLYWLKTFKHLKDIVKNVHKIYQSIPSNLACARVLQCLRLPSHAPKIWFIENTKLRAVSFQAPRKCV